MTDKKTKVKKTAAPKSKVSKPAKKKKIKKPTIKASERYGVTLNTKPIFKTPEELFERACEYFLWAEANPLVEQKLFMFQGKVITGTSNKMRAFTLQGLCIFMNIGTQTLRDYNKREAYSGVTTRIYEIIYDQKFVGAAADMLNPNIIARDLGLADKVEVEDITNDMEDYDKIKTMLSKHGIDIDAIK